MSDLKQCSSCRQLFVDCPHYTAESESPCLHYEKPIDNSRMFSHWYTWKGRIGRFEYIMTVLVISIIGITISGLCLSNMNNDESDIILIILMGLIAVINRYLTIVAGIKRCHDSRTSIIYAFLISCLSLSPMAVIGVVAAFYLLIQKGEEETNKYGTVPQKPYGEQVYSMKEDMQ